LKYGNARRMPFKIHPLWTPGAPGVLFRSGIVCAGIVGGVLIRLDQSGSWVGPRWSRPGLTCTALTSDSCCGDGPGEPGRLAW
jgi:hypothetical protein